MTNPTKRYRISDERLSDKEQARQTRHAITLAALNRFESDANVAERELLARRAAEAQRPTWQPIETAPKGRIIIMFAVTGRHEDGRVANWKMATGNFDFSGDRLTWDGNVIDKPYQHRPTHWMPLPAPPDGGRDQ